jgi:hypothetical protein
MCYGNKGIGCAALSRYYYITPYGARDYRLVKSILVG